MFWKKSKKIGKKGKKKQKSKEEKKVEEMMRADSIRPQFHSKRKEEKYEKLRREAYGDEAYEREKKFNKQAERNLIGIELEKVNKVDKAIELYELNIKEKFIGSHPYNRLAIIYRKRNQLDDEIRVLEKAILAYKNNGPKLTRFKERLEKVRVLKSK